MPDIATERAHLATAERDIAAGEERIFRQAEMVARLRMANEDTAQAEALLRNFRQTLQGWRMHRDQIVRLIASLES